MSNLLTSPFKAPLVAGGYHLLRQVGAGEHGVVYEGKHTRTGERVAIKQHHNPQQGKREAEVLAVLAHPLIPALKAFHQWRGASYLVMEWVEGTPLLQYSSRGTGLERLSLTEVFQVGFQLCDLLAYLHAQRVLHRDVNLCNVLRQPGNITLTDFGQAELRQAGEMSREAMSLDTDDARLLLWKLLPPEIPSELAWQIRGTSSQVEVADEMRASLTHLAALCGALGVAA